uniref:TF-B3 domain-containing protein n=1 Tax=Salix viminalis TaxID=40686 RepID=A0A6N2MM77_SALVM
MEIELVKKKLTRTDIASCLAYPTGSLTAFRMGQGQNAVNFNARDPTGRVWGFRLCTRNHGRYEKPVIRGEWLGYVREKGLTVDDFIILTMVEDAENGVGYNIRVEPNLELAI